MKSKIEEIIKKHTDSIVSGDFSPPEGPCPKCLENPETFKLHGLLLNEHREDAGNELLHYRQKVDECYSLYNDIKELEQKKRKTGQEKKELNELTEKIFYTLSLDYQQSKLTPHWGFSPQPGETYYLRKLSHNIFGIVDHATDKNYVYVLDERIAGAKNGNMTVSLVNRYVAKTIPHWVQHLCIFMDNGATNKNQFMIQWAMELVERNDFESIRMCYFVPGYAKNDVDRLFSRISNSFSNNDVFTSEQLVDLIQNVIVSSGKCIHIKSSDDIVNWKDLLGNKYNPLKNIKNYRDFMIKRNHQGKVVVKHKTCCYYGDYDEYSNLLKQKVDAALDVDLAEKIKKYSNEAKNCTNDLSQAKIADLIKMYDKFLDPISEHLTRVNLCRYCFKNHT
jgi:hypothetical protein